MSVTSTLAYTSYFRVQDPEAFEAWCRKLEFEVYKLDDPKTGLLYSFEAPEEGFPLNEQEDPTTGELQPSLFLPQLAAHLAPSWVAELRTITYTQSLHGGTHYAGGFTLALNCHGGTIEISLDDMAERITRTWGTAYQHQLV